MAWNFICIICQAVDSYKMSVKPYFPKIFQNMIAATATGTINPCPAEHGYTLPLQTE